MIRFFIFFLFCYGLSASMFCDESSGPGSKSVTTRPCLLNHGKRCISLFCSLENEIYCQPISVVTSHSNFKRYPSFHPSLTPDRGYIADEHYFMVLIRGWYADMPPKTESSKMTLVDALKDPMFMKYYGRTIEASTCFSRYEKLNFATKQMCYYWAVITREEGISGLVSVYPSSDYQKERPTPQRKGEEILEISRILAPSMQGCGFSGKIFESVCQYLPTATFVAQADKDNIASVKSRRKYGFDLDFEYTKYIKAGGKKEKKRSKIKDPSKELHTSIIRVFDRRPSHNDTEGQERFTFSYSGKTVLSASFSTPLETLLSFFTDLTYARPLTLKSLATQAYFQLSLALRKNLLEQERIFTEASTSIGDLKQILNDSGIYYRILNKKGRFEGMLCLEKQQKDKPGPLEELLKQLRKASKSYPKETFLKKIRQELFTLYQNYRVILPHDIDLYSFFFVGGKKLKKLNDKLSKIDKEDNERDRWPFLIQENQESNEKKLSPTSIIGIPQEYNKKYNKILKIMMPKPKLCLAIRSINNGRQATDHHDSDSPSTDGGTPTCGGTPKYKKQSAYYRDPDSPFTDGEYPTMRRILRNKYSLQKTSDVK